MSQLFSPARFGRLLRKHNAEHGRTHLLALAVHAGGLMLVLLLAAYISGGPLITPVQQVFFALFIFGAGLLVTSSAFAALGDRRQAVAWLLVPASHLEKFLVAWLYSLPLLLLVYVPVFFGVDALVLRLSAWQGQPYHLMPLLGGREPIYLVLVCYAALHAVALWAAVRFESQHFVKLGLLLCVLVLGLTTLNFQALQLLLGRRLVVALPFDTVRFVEANARYVIGLPEQQEQVVIVVVAGVAALMWAAAYARLREKQL